MLVEMPTLNLRWKKDAKEAWWGKLGEGQAIKVTTLQQEWRLRDGDNQWYEWRDVPVQE